MTSYKIPPTETLIRAAMSRRRFLGGASAVGLGAMAATSMTAGRAFAQGTPKQGGTLIMGVGGGNSTDSLDPAKGLSQVPAQVYRIFGETLVEVNADGTLGMRVAEDITSSPDAKTWTFKIRDGITFHNGQPLTAEDVLQTMLRHSDESSESGALGIMKGISSMRAEGSNFIVELDAPNADLPYLMSDYHLQIQPNGGHDDPEAGIGSNAYKLVSAEAGVRYVFEKNADYWDDTRGHFDGVELLVINDGTARNSALQSGQVHIINNVAPKVAGLLDRAPGVSVKSVSGRGHYAFVMQTDEPPFDNKDLRLAMKYAINREEMVDKILRGYGSVGNDIPINAAYPFFDDTIEQISYDPEKAAELYKKSGHDGSPIVLHVAEVAFPGAIDAAQLYRESAQAAGIPLEIQREPDDGFWADVWRNVPLCATYWSGRPVQDQMYSTAYLSSADWNETDFHNEEFDALLVEARGELDPSKRTEMYGKLGRIVQQEGGLIAPMFNDWVEGVSDDVQGWEADGVWEMMNNNAPHKCWFS